MTSSGGYSLHLLGEFQLRDATGAMVLSASKPLAVLAYLACARGQRASRQALVAMLWGDVDPERGRASLRQALFALRQRIGVELIVADGEWLTLTAPLKFDVRDFLEAVEAGKQAWAISCYPGDFIPDFAAPGAAEFEAWTDTERRRLRGAFLAVARSHLRDLLGGGDASAAVELAGRLRDWDPEDDEHWRLRFEALALAGRFAVVDLEESQLRAARADDDRAVDVGTETLLRRLRRAASDARLAATPSQSSSRIPGEPEFQGRSEVFAQMLTAWGLVCRGRAQRRSIVAGAGLGKTRLLRELARRLAAQRARVVHVGARQGERDDPFAFLAEVVTRIAELSGSSGVAPASASVLAGLVPTLADTFNVKPEDGVTDSNELLRRRALALADLVGAVADDRPLALLVDDQQWADAASLQAIDRAFARAPRIPLLLVTASRVEQASFGTPDERLPLPPLDLGEVAMLIASIAVAEPSTWSDALTARIHAASGGSPFTVLQFLHLALERNVIGVVGDRWEVPDEAAVQPLLDRSAAVEWRLGALNDTDRTTLTCLSLAEQPIGETVLAEMSGAEPEVVRESLHRMEADAFVARTSGDSWRVAHDLVSEGALAIAGDAIRRGCAERIAEILGRSVAPSDIVAARRIVRLHLDARRADAAVWFVRGWLAQQPRDAWTPDELPSLLLGGHSNPEFEAQVRKVMRARKRWWRSRMVLAVASVVVTLGVVGFGMLRPVGLVLTSTVDPTEASRAEFMYEVAPRVELRNAIGGVSTRRDGDTVRMTPAGVSGELLGRPFAVLHDGVAVFDSVYPAVELSAEALITDVRFTLPSLPPLVLRKKARADSLAIVGSVLNGQASQAASPVLRVRPGEAIRGSVQVRYTTMGRDILYVMAQAATWGRGERDTSTVRSLLAGVTGARFFFTVDATAPTRPGDYWLFWTQGTEPSAGRLLSGTNWKCPKPVWGDGNDLPLMADSILALAVQRGEIMIRQMMCDDGVSYTGRRLPVAGVRVEVR